MSDRNKKDHQVTTL